MSSRDLIARMGDIRELAYRFILRELAARGVRGWVPSHGATLSVLFHEGQMRMSELAERIHRDKSTVTTLVGKLEEFGYVTRRKDPTDARASCVLLTKKGRALESTFREISEQLLERTYRGFTKAEREQLASLLERVFGNWEEA